MCGISGIVAFNDAGRVCLPCIHDAVGAMYTRGPDKNGTFFHGNVALGHNRLSIIDISEAASQPFSSDDGRFTIVFNGEFFNFKQHRSALLKEGVSLRSSSDTEVLLHLYIKEGAECLKKINGFFALAIYDRLTEELFIARDRFGVKPLLIYRNKDKLMFSSEMKGLMAMGIPKELDTVSLYTYLQMNYIPGPGSIFKNVMKLPPGHCLCIKGSDVQDKCWYNIPYDAEAARSNSISYSDAQKEIVRLLDGAVERRLISDVPLGAFLSGGVDSSIIVALASRHTNHLNTFSIGFSDEPFFDETRYAQLVADKYKTNHTIFSLTTDELYEALMPALDYLDEPFADSSALAVNILSRETRKHVTVALSGDGADELYGGYLKHVAEEKARKGGLACGLVSMGRPLWKLLPQSRNSAFSNKVRQLDKFSEGLSMDQRERYWRWCSIARESEAAKMLSLPFSKEPYELMKSAYTEAISPAGDMNDIFLSDTRLVLPFDMLTKVDMMSMAHSLEVRTPFLDVDHVNFVFSLPARFKLDNGIRKKILQDAFREMLPEEIYQRPKHGFEVPLLRWMRTGLKNKIQDELLNDDFVQSQGIFNVHATKALKERIQSGNPGDAAARVWGLIVFQHWWKKHMA